MEIWKQILNSKGLPYTSKYIIGYFVSNYGHVISLKSSGKFQKLIPKKDRDGYLVVTLQYNCKSITKRVHQLVLPAFKGNYPKNCVIDHIDRNPANNFLNNLRYVTRKEDQTNTRISHSDAHQKEKKPVRCIESGEVFESNREASRKLGFASGSISYSCRTGGSCHGFHFEFN